MTISESRDLARRARGIGFTRREVLKFGMLAAGAALATACGSDKSAADAVVEEFAVGTWKVKYQLSSRSSATSNPKPLVEFDLTVNKDSTFTISGDPNLPQSGTWMVGNAFIQISADGTGMASNVPEKMGDASLTWQWDSSRAAGASFEVPAKWDSSSSTLTLTGVDGNRNQFPITATKQ
ncbi:hypothetical protein [Gordonia sihwensis]|nr:hypothetical protein [Gordonia sihwensis]